MKNIESDTVAICMATFNGEQFINEQIKSIIDQTYKNWILFIRDDNSNDATAEMLKSWAEAVPDQIVVLTDPTLAGGSASKNFAAIVNFIKSNYEFNYFMFADQDDYWLPEKIEKTLVKMKETEEKVGGPILVHTDLKVVDSELHILGDSFFKYRALKPEIKELSTLLVQNNVTGCTMMWNKLLNEITVLTDERVIMHDWWFTLTACCFGTIVCLEEPTILYRQHGKNAVGATEVNTLSFIVRRLLGYNQVKKVLKLSVVQAQAFLATYNHLLSPTNRKTVDEYSKLYNRNKINRIKTILRNNYLKQGLVQIIGEIMFI